MKRHVVTFLFLVLAIVFYSLGGAGPAIVLLLLGFIAEAMFWLRFLGIRRNRD